LSEGKAAGVAAAHMFRLRAELASVKAARAKVWGGGAFERTTERERGRTVFLGAAFCT
jgi:hypothetical protein